MEEQKPSIPVPHDVGFQCGDAFVQPGATKAQTEAIDRCGAKFGRIDRGGEEQDAAIFYQRPARKSSTPSGPL